MNLLEDTRAQSMTYIKAGGSIILFAGMYAVFQEPVLKLLDASAETTTTDQAAQGHTYISEMWSFLPLTVAGLIVLMLLSAAIFQSRGGL